MLETKTWGFMKDYLLSLTSFFIPSPFYNNNLDQFPNIN